MATPFVSSPAAIRNVTQSVAIGMPFAEARGGILNIQTLLEVVNDMADSAMCDTSLCDDSRGRFERIMKLTFIALEEAERAIRDVNVAEDGVSPFVIACKAKH